MNDEQKGGERKGKKKKKREPIFRLTLSAGGVGWRRLGR